MDVCVAAPAVLTMVDLVSDSSDDSLSAEEGAFL